MTPIQVGLIGYGFAGKVFHAPVIAAVPDLHLRAIVTSRTEQVRADYPDVSVMADAETLLADPAIELVIVATPNTSHLALAQAALAAGKSVVVDKPFTLTTADADALIQQAAAAGRCLSVFHNRRWDSDFRTVRQLVESGLLGEVMTYEAHYDRFRPNIQPRWREQDAPGSGILYDLGSHLIDQALQLFGPPETVSADLQRQRPGAQAVDYFHLVLGYRHQRIILHGGCLVRQPAFHFALHGARGSSIKQGLDPQEHALIVGRRPGSAGWGEEPAAIYGELTTEINGLPITGRIASLPGAYDAYYQVLAQAIRQGTPPLVTAQEARQVIPVIEHALISHRRGQVIAFNDSFHSDN